MARPKIEIDADKVAELASFGCTNSEIAQFFGVNETTIRKRFSEKLQKARADIRYKLRKKQLEIAYKGNVTMLIWLGKQMLGQADKAEVTGKDGGPVIIRTIEAVKPGG